eukprot:Skav235083  [mRNA]  locus=scaffold2106:72854:73489:- [translate_table: standard]
MSLQKAVHQMNALSHLGFLIQMYISHLSLDDLHLTELQELKNQKDLVESMHRLARARCEQDTAVTQGAGAVAGNVAVESFLEPRKEVSFAQDPKDGEDDNGEDSRKDGKDGKYGGDGGDGGEEKDADGGRDLPSCHLDLSFLSDPGPLSDTSPASAATVFKLKSFVIPRMKSRLGSRKSLSSVSVSPDRSPAKSEPSRSSFRDWNLGEESW